MNKKTGKAVLIGTTSVIAAAAAATVAGGAFVHRNIISEKACRKDEERAFSSMYFIKRYANNDNLRNADDWFCEKVKEDTLLINEKGQTLKADIIMAEKPSHKWAVVVHGLYAMPRMISLQGHHYYLKGYNILFPCQRAHGTSEFKNCSLGYFERYDIINWINYIISIDPEAEIILHGTSMGASTVMMTIGEELPSNVKVAVEDCGYTDCYTEFNRQIKKMIKVPPFPFVGMARIYTKLFHGWDFKDCDCLKAVERTKIPVIFIHGDKDKIVPFDMLDKLYNACPTDKAKLEVKGVGHDRSCEKQPELYWNAIEDFIKKYI